MQPADTTFQLTRERNCAVVQLTSVDGTNKLQKATVAALLTCINSLCNETEAGSIKAVIITGNEHFFSAGADLNEISRLTGADAFEFAQLGQQLMWAVDRFPVPVIAAIRGYCMGGGLDLALACDYRIAAPNTIFGHRGVSLGMVTGWGGTQRLPRLIGKARALQMFLLAEKIHAQEALRIGLVDWVDQNPIASAESLQRGTRSLMR